MPSRTSSLLGLAFLVIPLVAFAGPDMLEVSDVLRLHEAGVSEDVILSEIMVTESVFDLSVDEIVRLHEAGLSERLILFMIDTRATSTDESATSYETEWLYADEDDYEPSTTWVNVIEEEPAVTYVTLDYSYPRWWYDCYWYDYWYWDFTYHPYRSSWCISVGTWYPGWYSWGSYYAYHPYWHGNRWNNYAHCGYSPWVDRGWYDRHHDYYAWDHHGSRDHQLSDVKYKSNGSSGGAFVHPMAPDRGLSLAGGKAIATKKDKVIADVGGVKGRDLDTKAVLDTKPPRIKDRKAITPVRVPARGERPTKVVRPPDVKIRDRPAPTRDVRPPVVKPRHAPTRESLAPSSPPRPVAPKVLSKPKTTSNPRPAPPPKPRVEERKPRPSVQAPAPQRSNPSRPREARPAPAPKHHGGSGKTPAKR